MQVELDNQFFESEMTQLLKIVIKLLSLNLKNYQ